MKLNKRHWFALSIALLFIVSAILQANGMLNINPEVKKNIDLVLMVLAFSFLFGGKKKKTPNTDESKDDKIDIIKDIDNKNTEINNDNK